MRIYLLLPLCLPLFGCGTGPTLVPVSGRILVDGKPVPNLRVTFAPEPGDNNPYPGPGSIGHTDEEGRYTLHSALKDKTKGAVPGPCVVRITTAGSNPKTGPADTRHLPDRYNDKTTLKYVVPPGGTDSANFDISWEDKEGEK